MKKESPRMVQVAAPFGTIAIIFCLLLYCNRPQPKIIPSTNSILELAKNRHRAWCDFCYKTVFEPYKEVEKRLIEVPCDGWAFSYRNRFQKCTRIEYDTVLKQRRHRVQIKQSISSCSVLESQIIDAMEEYGVKELQEPRQQSLP